LQILPHISTEQLHAATSVLADAENENEDAGRLSPDRRSSPPVLNKKTGIDYWENFPLTSIDGIRRWQRDCEVHSANDCNQPVKLEHRHSSPGTSTRMLSEDASTSRKKRQSMGEHKPSSRFSGDASTFNGLLGLQNQPTSSAQVIQAQNEQIRVALDQQRLQNTWHSQIMQPTTNRAVQHPSLHRQQPFGQHDYFSNPSANSWQAQHDSMNVDILNSQPTNQPDAIPAITSQTHSHLFW